MTIEKKRILFMVPSLGMGGMERALINYANLLVKRGYSITIMNLTSHHKELITELSDQIDYRHNVTPVPHLLRANLRDIISLNFRILNLSNWLKRSSPKYLYKKYVKDDFDVEIAFYGGSLIRIINASTNVNSIKIGWVHGQTVERHIRYFSSYKEARDTYNHIEKLICVSNVVKDKVTELFGRNNNLYVICNPNNTDHIRSLAKIRPDLRKNKFAVVTVSRIDIESKGLDRLIEAIAKLNSEGIEYEVWVIGDGVDFEKLKVLISNKGIKNIKLLGGQVNPYQYINEADLYICSSRFEGFSMVMAETLIIGKPMVSTDISGAREMLGDSEFGLIVDNNTEGIYYGLKTMLTDSQIYLKYCEQAQKRKDFFNEEKIIDELENIINHNVKEILPDNVCEIPQVR